MTLNTAHETGENSKVKAIGLSHGVKRILIFSLAYYPKFIGGAEVAIREITDRIDPCDIEFHMITNRYDSNLSKIEKVGNVLVHRIGIARKGAATSDLKGFPLNLNKGLYQFFAFFYALRLHRKYRYDGIWAMMAHATGVPAGLFKSVHKNVPYILTLQEGDPPEYIERKMAPFGPLFRRAFTLANTMQSISTFLDTWGKQMGFRGDAHVVPNGVALAHFSEEPEAERIAQIREKIGMREGDICLVTTSRLVPKNGVDTVIRALPDLSKNIRFVIYGEGPEEKRLKELAREQGVYDRVHFMGHISHEEMPAALRAAHIFIRASRSEGMGNSFIEAMAAGLPVIATPVGGIPDFLRDGETGYLAQPDDPKSVASAVMRVLTDADHAQTICANARRMVQERYDWGRIAEQMRIHVFHIGKSQ